jgi:synaptobrevin family protein YKT6
MKLIGLAVLRVDPTSSGEAIVCASSCDVSEYGFLQRGAAREFITFGCRTVAKRTAPMSRMRVNEQANAIFCQSFAGGRLAVACVTDREYNERVGFNLVSIVAEKFQAEFRGRWEAVDKDNMLSWPELDTLLKKYQNPAEADQIMKIQNDINATKTIMVDAIDQVLARGEKIDDLVLRSQDLSDSSKVFYNQARGMNSWCGNCAVA